MKIIIISLLGLLVGFGVGFGVGWHSNDKQTTNEAVQALMDSSESIDRLEAWRAIVAIGMIESGETQKTVQFISKPIVQYYYSYEGRSGTNAATLRARIEQIAKTNKIVGDELTNQKANFEISGKDGKVL